MNTWAALETPLKEAPEFFVEGPDKEKHLSERQRCTLFLQLMRIAAPAVDVFHISNEGKRSPYVARSIGIRSGVFDYCCTWRGKGVAWIEFKGFDSRKRPGVLSANQISWGNRQLRKGHDVACFFTPELAVKWLRECGAPVGQIR